MVTLSICSEHGCTYKINATFNDVARSVGFSLRITLDFDRAVDQGFHPYLATQMLLLTSSASVPAGIP